MVNRLRPGTARYVELARTDHDLQTFKTIEDAYADTPGAVPNDKAYFDALGAFIKEALR
jgi:hypothetical protein